MSQTVRRIWHRCPFSPTICMRARILLMSEATQPEKVSIKKLAEILGTTDTTIQTVRTEYAAGGVEAAVYRKQRTCAGYNSKRQARRQTVKRNGAPV